MNKRQRGKIERIKDTIDDLVSEIREEAEAEQEKFDNASEGLKQTERFQTIERIASNLDEAVNNLEQVSSDLDAALTE